MLEEIKSFLRGLGEWACAEWQSSFVLGAVGIVLGILAASGFYAVKREECKRRHPPMHFMPKAGDVIKCPPGYQVTLHEVFVSCDYCVGERMYDDD